MENPKVRLDAQRLDIAMASEGISSDIALAKKASITGRTIRNIRHTGRCTFEVWERIATAVNWNPIDLIVVDGYPDPKSVALANLLH